jgi:MinD-like ATPase involved in chromosome partitioning or flagellar assembly
MHDQADQLRKLVRATVEVDATLAPGGPVLAISGGQPQAGVTTIACGLARELARLGKQVVLIDANLQRPRAHEVLGFPQEATNARSSLIGTLHDVLTGKRRAAEILIATSEDSLRLLPGCPPDSAPPLDRAAVERFAAELVAVTRQVDVVLLDAGAGMNAWIDRLWQLARQVLLVAPPGSQPLLDSYAAVKLSQHHRLEGKLRLLVNRTTDESEVPLLGKRFEETCQRFLFITPQPASSLPIYVRTARNDATAVADDQFARAIRLLAADLACDFRVAALRLVRPKDLRQHSIHDAMKAPGSAGGQMNPTCD